MANLCEYDMRAVSKDKDSLDKIIAILKGENPEKRLYKTYSAIVHYPPRADGDLWDTIVVGDMGWDVDNWLNPPDVPLQDICRELGRELGVYVGKRPNSQNVSLQDVCRELEVGVEIWGRESNMGFQMHILVDFLGNVSMNEVRDWNPCAEEDGEDNEDENGFPDYDEFMSSAEIYLGTAKPE